MREFDTAKRDGRVRKRLEPGHQRAAPLDCAVVLLDDIVEILRRRVVVTERLPDAAACGWGTEPASAGISGGHRVSVEVTTR